MRFLPPPLERVKRPQLAASVRAAGQVVGDDFLYVRGIEQALSFKVVRTAVALEVAPKLSLQPQPDRDTEAAFRGGQEVRRKDISERIPEDDFLFLPADLPLGRQRKDELDEFPRQHGHPGLDGGQHAAPVDLRQHVPFEDDMQIHVLGDFLHIYSIIILCVEFINRLMNSTQRIIIL